MNRNRIAALILVVVAYASVAEGQAPPAQPSALDRLRTATATEFEESDRREATDYVAVLLLRARETSRLVPLLVKNEEERSDEQLGATSSAPGTTTLVSKGTVPKVLSFAVENGALTQSQSGTTVTFRGNLGGSVRALAGKGFFELEEGSDASLRLLNTVSFSASFDTSRGNNAGVQNFSGDQQQLSQWTARLQLVNHRDNQGSRAMRAWAVRLTPKLVGIAAASSDVSGALGLTGDAALRDPRLSEWWTTTTLELAAAKAAARTARKTPAEAVADLVEVLKRREKSLPPDSEMAPGTRAVIGTFDTAAAEFVTERETVLSALKGGALVSLEYTNDRPLKAPKTSNLRLVGEMGGAVDLTGNMSLTIFDGRPTGAGGRVRDFQASAELGFKMGSADTIGAFVLSLSGKFVRQFENSYDDGGIMLPDTKGTTAIGQLKITVPTKGTGVRIPLSITVANRTDLIKERIVRANVGLSYDLDVVLSKFRP